MAETLEIIISATDKASGVLGKLKTGLGSLGGLAKGALLGGVGLAVTGATAALGGLTAGLGLAVSEAMDAEGVMAQLDAVLKSTGGAAGVTSDMATDLADSLMGVTRFTDDAVLAGENILLTFTNIGKDVFPQTTQTMLDMSQALGQDLQSSAVQLGKALQDPITGVTALRRVGVNFTEAQTDMIKGLVESGDLMGAQTMILKELQTEFGGSAEAAGGTFAGQLDILKNTMTNVAEEAGGVLIPILTEGLQAITPVLIELAENFASFISSDQFKAWLSEVGVFMRDQLVPAIVAVADFTMNTLVPALAEAYVWFRDNVIPVISDVVRWITQELIPAITRVAGFIRDVLVGAAKTLRTAWENDFGGIASFLTGFFNQAKLVFQLWQAAFQGDWRRFGEILREIVVNSWRTIITTIGELVSDIKKVFITTDWAALGKAILQGIADGLGKFVGILWQAARNAASAALEAIKGFLGIESPSKVMADQVGRMMALGIGEGLMAGMRGLSFGAPMLAMAPVSAAGASAIVVNYSPMVSFADEYELEQRLRPVIERAMRRR